MNTTKFLAILSLLGFSLSGFLFLKNQKEEKACREEISKQDFNPKDEGTDGGISISEILERNTVPAWRSVKFFNTAVSIPYSEKWKIRSVGISAFDEEGENEHRIYRFGKPMDGGTLIEREYFLERSEKKNLEILLKELSGGCGEGVASEKIQIGSIYGVKHYAGGARGCSVGIAFVAGKHTFSLYRVSDIGQDAPEINEEMKKIILSIH